MDLQQIKKARRPTTTHQKTGLNITLTDSFHFESDKMNNWILEAKEPKKNGPFELKHYKIWFLTCINLKTQTMVDWGAELCTTVC